ncbi:MAG: hypothetical protein MJ142_02385, partial [Clostridia bacterium]|nr:hypothetical protein [Clostridia bacterium]
MKNYLKRFTAWVMSLVMIMTMMPTTGLATWGTLDPLGGTKPPVITFRFVDETGGDYLGLNDVVKIPDYTPGQYENQVQIGNLVNWAEKRNNYSISALGAKLNQCYDDTISYEIIRKDNGQRIYDQWGAIPKQDADVEVICHVNRMAYEYSYNYNGWDMYDNQPAGNHSVIDTPQGPMQGGNFKLSIRVGDVVHVWPVPHMTLRDDVYFGTTDHNIYAWLADINLSASSTFNKNTVYYENVQNSKINPQKYYAGAYSSYFIMPARSVNMQGHFSKLSGLSEVTIKSESIQYVYNGKVQKYDVYTVTGKDSTGLPVNFKKENDYTFTATIQGQTAKYIIESTSSVKNVTDSKDSNNTFTYSATGGLVATGGVKTQFGRIDILPINVTLTSGNAEKVYDGTALTNADVADKL